MRIYGPNGTTLGTSTGSTRRTSSSGFSLPDATSAQEEVRCRGGIVERRLEPSLRPELMDGWTEPIVALEKREKMHDLR